MGTNSDNHVSLKEIRDTFYKLRDFEISNLWQRSIFLTAFTVLIASGYGILVLKLLEGDAENILILHEACCGLALLGIIFSIIWIMMAKGSKAWYEVYEGRINEVEEETVLKIEERYRMSADCVLRSLDSNIWTNKAGKYSVSKLNIFIGKVLLITWGIALIIHYVFAIIAFSNSYINTNCVIHTIVLVILVVLPLLILITAMCNLWAKSSSLSDYSQNEQ